MNDGNKASRVGGMETAAVNKKIRDPLQDRRDRSAVRSARQLRGRSRLEQSADDELFLDDFAECSGGFEEPL
jgi:hypothetical protein